MGGRVDKLMIQRVPMKYRQFDEETCSFMSLASALQYCASELNVVIRIFLPGWQMWFHVFPKVGMHKANSICWQKK